ncbi:hypothetical protein SAMN05192566_1829 [Methylophilus rhizosphaerae]|uniref:Uncharacterized protein n=1 Tax=Methylophilus rhizosphaerae TaxID=492660 RepID=A0A1G9D7T0_9PROT|nr:hypothetical protein SAMN05192566_1829 [Methylophilus rhizosphaerae]
MRLFLSKSVWNQCGNSGATQDQSCCPKSSDHERGVIEIGKINLILIALIGVILLTLLSQDHSRIEEEEPPLRIQTQPAAGIVATTAEETTAPEEAPASAAPAESNVSRQQHQENDEPASPVTETHTRPLSPAAKNPRVHRSVVTETHTTQEPVQIDTSRHTIVFSIWSVSELRLRSAYTQVMNDSSMTASQQQLIKKDYLDFVNRRTQKCGELDNKFASNINTVEKLTFDEKSLRTLECHSSENVSELERLSTLDLHHP